LTDEGETIGETIVKGAGLEETVEERGREIQTDPPNGQAVGTIQLIHLLLSLKTKGTGM
jgi:hypothetical protein